MKPFARLSGVALFGYRVGPSPNGGCAPAGTLPWRAASIGWKSHAPTCGYLSEPYRQ